MKVECIHCGASGKIDESKIPPGVTSLKCPKCSQSFPVPTVSIDSDVPAPVQTVQEPAEASVSPRPVETVTSPPVEQAGCTVCGGQFPMDEMVRFGASWVCAACKPGYVQMLAQGTPQPGELRYAGFGIRLGAKILDGLILGVISLMISLAIGFILPKSSPEVAIAVAALSFVLQTAIGAGYSGYFLHQHRATPGKMACGLVVIHHGGDQVSVMRGVGRYFAELLSSMTLLVGYLMILFDGERRALHDRICNTRVVYK